jgi:hypothetical protein
VSGRAGDLARSVDRDQGKALLGVELWAEIRRLKHVEGFSQREIHRRTGVHRDTIRNALASLTPPVYGPRPPRPSKLEPFVGVIEELLAEEPTLSGVRIREELENGGLAGDVPDPHERAEPQSVIGHAALGHRADRLREARECRRYQHASMSQVRRLLRLKARSCSCASR